MTSTSLIKIVIKLNHIRQFFNENDVTWAAHEFNRIDVLPFCDLLLPKKWHEHRTIMELNPDHEYQMQVVIEGKEKSSTYLEKRIIICQEVSTEQSFKAWSDFFQSTQKGADENWIKGLVTNGNSLTIHQADYTLPSGIDAEFNVKTATYLPTKYALYYTVFFQFSAGGITRYCRIDPLIRTNSGDD